MIYHQLLKLAVLYLFIYKYENKIDFYFQLYTLNKYMYAHRSDIAQITKRKCLKNERKINTFPKNFHR